MSSFWIGLLVPLVLAVVAATARPEARRAGDERIVEYGAGLRALSAFFAGLATLIALASLFLGPEDRPWVIGIAGIFAFISGLLLPQAYFTKFSFGQGGITSHRPWRKPRPFAWSEIASVQYSPGEKSYVLVMLSGDKLKLHPYMSGVHDLLKEMQSRKIHGALLAGALASQTDSGT
jgi:hypothetical protein